jgi:DhnA family fructose-bisphosphate aldolase class Ia
MSYGKQLRVRRFLGRGRAVIVAIDHGNAAGVVRGLETPIEVVKLAVQAGADGILVTPGVLEQVVAEIEDLAIILRIDGGVSTLGSGPMRLFSSVEDALSMGADAVVVNATVGALHESSELQKVGRVATDGRRWGMPVVAEMLTQRIIPDHYDFSGNGRSTLPADIADEISMACRIGAELGADVIKTRYPGDIAAFQHTVVCAGRPVLIAGGPLRSPNLEGILSLVDDSLQAGGSGVIFGRSIWQQPDPGLALRALCAMVHEDASVSEALEMAQE